MADVTAEAASEVARLLDSSRLAHSLYRSQQAKRTPGGLIVRGNEAEGRAALVRALAVREAAEALDPAHTAPAWNEETQHRELLIFYRQQMAR